MSNVTIIGGGYKVTDDGKVFNRRGMELKQYMRGNCNYKHVNLKHNGMQKMALVHRLVAMAYIDNPDDKPCVNHKDGNKLNNDASNLEWVTHSENSLHSCYELGNVKGHAPMSGKFGDAHNKSKAIIVESPQGNRIRYGSCRLMKESTGICNTLPTWLIRNDAVFPHTIKRGKSKGWKIIEYPAVAA